MKIKKEFLSPKEVAAILGVSRATIYRLIGDGELPALQIGASLRVPSHTLRQWIEDRQAAFEKEACGLDESTWR